MSFRKPQAQSGKFQRWEKVLALRTIDALPQKPGGKRYSNPELAEIVTKTLKRPMTKETIRKWLKNRDFPEHFSIKNSRFLCIVQLEND